MTISGSGSALPASQSLDLRRDRAGHALRRELTHGFAYWDCRVDDARLVVLNARAARAKEARPSKRARGLLSARREDGVWRVLLETRRSRARGARARTCQRRRTVGARCRR